MLSPAIGWTKGEVVRHADPCEDNAYRPVCIVFVESIHFRIERGKAETGSAPIFLQFRHALATNRH